MNQLGNAHGTKKFVRISESSNYRVFELMGVDCNPKKCYIPFTILLFHLFVFPKIILASYQSLQHIIDPHSGYICHYTPNILFGNSSVEQLSNISRLLLYHTIMIPSNEMKVLNTRK